MSWVLFEKMLFLLLAGHAVADFALQSDAMARGKNRNSKITPPPGQKLAVCWPYWLTAHALVNGFFVAAVSAWCWPLGICETIVHWVADFCKCENWTNPHIDQAIHVASKILWAYLLANCGHWV